MSAAAAGPPAGPRARPAGEVVVVSGATSGIGRASALLLLARGAHVVATGRDPAALAALAAEAQGRPGTLTTVAADARETGAARRVVAAALERHGALDGAVLCAGVGHLGPVVSMGEGEGARRLAELVDTNVRGTFLLAAAAAAAIVGSRRPDGPVRAGGRPRGALVVVGSIAGAVGVPGESAYSATKAAAHALVPLLREEVAPLATVALVVPGVVDTAFFVRRGQPYQRSVPRPVAPERVAAAVLAALADGRDKVVPAWLGLPARLAGAAPRTYRALARRLS